MPGSFLPASSPHHSNQWVHAFHMLQNLNVISGMTSSFKLRNYFTFSSCSYITQHFHLSPERIKARRRTMAALEHYSALPGPLFSGVFSLGPANGPRVLTKEYITSTLCPWLCLRTRSWGGQCHQGLSSTFPLKNHMERSWGYSSGTLCLLLAPPTSSQLAVFRDVLLFSDLGVIGRC